jgi:hypothetical protein
MNLRAIRRSILSLAAGGILASGAAAHHGGAIEWGQDAPEPITGTATEFQFRFPHVAVRIDVEVDGHIENWAMTTRWTPTILRRMGWRHDSIKPGDKITVTYRPHVTEPRVFQMGTIRVNGTELSLEQSHE